MNRSVRRVMVAVAGGRAGMTNNAGRALAGSAMAQTPDAACAVASGTRGAFPARLMRQSNRARGTGSSLLWRPC